MIDELFCLYFVILNLFFCCNIFEVFEKIKTILRIIENEKRISEEVCKSDKMAISIIFVKIKILRRLVENVFRDFCPRNPKI